MLIDNKKDRYPDDGFNIKTVWDFIRVFAGRKIDQPEDSPTGNLDIALATSRFARSVCFTTSFPKKIISALSPLRW